MQTYPAGSWQPLAVNDLSMSDLYPVGQPGMPTGEQAGSGYYPDMTAGWGASDAGGQGSGGYVAGSIGPSGAAAPAGGAAAAPGGWIAKPLTWVFVLAIMAAGIMFTAHRTGRDEEFKSIRASAYNMFFVGLVAIVIILIMKAIFGRFKVPGLSSAVMAV